MVNALLEQLSQPFAPEAITWKPGSTTKDGNKCLAMAYADLRAYQDRLDEVCGMDWSVRYLPWCDGRIICELTISGVTRASTGEMDAQDEKNGMGGTVAEAQAMKRAGAQFGLGRYLYELPSVSVEYDAQRKRISDSGQAELDNRYKTWYKKAMAARGKQSAQDAPQATQSPQDARKDEKTQYVDVGFDKPVRIKNKPVDATTERIVQPDASVFVESDSSTPVYAHLIDSLTGDCLERASRARNFHAQGKGPATPEQYRYLSGVIDDLVGVQKAHNAILEVFVGRAVNGENPPSILLASKLLDALVKEKSEEVDGKKVMTPNPLYSIAAVNCVHTVWRHVQRQTGNRVYLTKLPRRKRRRRRKHQQAERGG